MAGLGGKLGIFCFPKMKMISHTDTDDNENNNNNNNSARKWLRCQRPLLPFNFLNLASQMQTFSIPSVLLNPKTMTDPDWSMVSGRWTPFRVTSRGLKPIPTAIWANESATYWRALCEHLETPCPAARTPSLSTVGLDSSPTVLIDN